MSVDYSMRISRLTVDKLGVKLYDRASAVIAELIANAYDADAQRVTVSAPMGQYLATKAGGRLKDRGFTITVEDDGTGMTPEEVQAFFLVVGAERRTDPNRGDRSRKFDRRVMGRKGVGKLAPFGICKVIEVLSAGGQRISRAGEDGYLTSHIAMNYDDIVVIGDEPDERYKPEKRELDETLSEKPGTTITLLNFNFRRVPDMDTLSRQIAQRFGIESENWKITVSDNTKTGSHNTKTVGAFDIQTMSNTKLIFKADRGVVGPDQKPVNEFQAGFSHDGRFYGVTGWTGYSKVPYSDDLVAGVRIYCRGKIAAQTSIFNRKAGFTGEHNIRSYLVGELHADWLDEDEDLIQTDRRDILWSDELASSFQKWGQKVVQRIGTLSRDPMRKATLDLFLETGHVEERIQNQFPSESHKEIQDNALELAKMFGQRISRAEAEDESVVEHFVDLSIEFAPHITLDQMMEKAVEDSDTPLPAFVSFLRTARIAELSSFGRIAEDRLKVISRLETLKDDNRTKEDSLQHLIEDAPWLINPEWAPVIANQSLNRLRTEFEKYFESQTGQSINLSNFRDPRKRPDFVLSSQEGIAQIVEIKRPCHALVNDEMDRIINYHDCMQSFLADSANADFRRFFHGFHITLVCDDLALTGAQRAAFQGYLNDKLTHINWRSFLLKTEEVHKDFLEEARRQRALTVEITDS